MDDTTLYIQLQGAIDRAKGAVLWSDVCLALKRVQESKVRESLTSLFSEMDLPTLAHAHAIAERETLTLKPAAPSVSMTPAPAQPAALLAPPPTPKPGKRKRKR